MLSDLALEKVLLNVRQLRLESTGWAHGPGGFHFWPMVPTKRILQPPGQKLGIQSCLLGSPGH